MAHRFSETKIVLVIATVACAVYFPCAFWIEADYQASRPKAPAGAVAHLGYFAPVEMESLSDEIRAARHQYFQTVFRWTEEIGWPAPEDGVSNPRISIYENGLSLGTPVIEYVPYSRSYALAFHTSDDTDPRRNGRDYWMVRQSE